MKPLPLLLFPKPISLKRWLWVLIWVCSGVLLVQSSFGQTPTPTEALHIREVYIEGNYRTRERIVLRELDYHPGDTLHLADTAKRFAHIREKLYNTRLFNHTKILLGQYQAPDSFGQLPTVRLMVLVDERWYTFPYPILELADRTFNEWWYNRNRDLTRINYGFRVTQHNATGNNDPLKLGFQWGFTQRIDLSYRFPYLDKSQRSGLSFAANYMTNDQVAVRTLNNIQDFVGDRGAGILRTRSAMGFGYTYRKGYYTNYEAGLYFQRNRIADTLARANPAYYGQGRTTQNYLSLRLSFSYDLRNYRLFATKGYFLGVDFEQNGLTPWDNLHQTALRVRIKGYRPLYRQALFLASGLDVLASNPFRMPYGNLYGLGYSLRIVRGYDAQVVEAPVSAIWKTSLRYKVFDRTFANPLVSWRQFVKIPIQVYLKGHGDMGYAYHPFADPSNLKLTNTLLPGIGTGLEIVSFYDFVLRLEYSVNRWAQGGFYMYIGADV